LPESTIVNCTGLGARTLFGDDQLTAIKGQLTVLLPQPSAERQQSACRNLAPT
jgi:D-amino-acid oxidase